MIELSNINKTFFSKHSVHHALNNINLTVLPGEIMGVIGKSGAGKSTLIRCVNLLERPTSGLVRVNNIELTELTSTQLRQARHH
ncbi:MAG: ABC transporter related protein, partial [uncultured bacterium]